MFDWVGMGVCFDEFSISCLRLAGFVVECEGCDEMWFDILIAAEPMDNWQLVSY